MSSEQDKDLVAKKMHVACSDHSDYIEYAIIFPSRSRSARSTRSAPLAKRKMPFGNLLIPESVE